MSTKKNKSILFIIGSFYIGGKERQLIELIRGLNKLGYETHLIVKNYDPTLRDKVLNSLVSFHSFDQKRFHLLDFLKISRIIDQTRPDVVSTWVNVAGYFSFLFRLFSSHSYRLINCGIRNAPIQLPLSRKIERFMYTFFPVVVANSYAGLAAYGQENKNGRHVLYNGFDFSRIPQINRQEARQTLNLQTQKYSIVMVAGLTEKKDHNMYIDSAAFLLTKRDDITFFIVGEGARRKTLQAKVRNLGIESRVLFLGKRDDVELILRAADISVLTSTARFGEGISNTILESLACGTPVIATDSPGTREVIEDDNNGLIVPCGDHLKLAEKISLLLENKMLREQLGQRGKEMVTDKFSIKKMISGFINIIES